MKYPFVDLFSGAGGLTLGFRNAGFSPVFAADFERHACATYRRNLGDHVQALDLAKVPTSEVVSRVREISEDIAVVAGGPPCQGWSVQRRGSPSDERNDLVLKFFDIAVGIRPRAIVMENVPTIFGKRGEEHFQVVDSSLERAGYRVWKKVLDAADYSVPQNRRRAILVAVRSDLSTRYRFPEPSIENGRFSTVREAIADLPEPPPDGSDHPAFPNHRLVLVSDLNKLRLSHVPEGGGRLDIPEELQLPCHRNSNGHRHLDVYGRLWWDKPAGTITAMFDNFTRGRFAHPCADRNITSREGARLQSFPDWFVFEGGKKDVARQIGNAVAPKLAQAIAKSLIGIMSENPASVIRELKVATPDLAMAEAEMVIASK